MPKSPCHPRSLPSEETAAEPVPFSKPANEDADHSELVRLIAWQIFSRVPKHASLELNDVIQAGYLGLLRARKTYRAESTVPFPIYARYRIRGEILDMLRRLDTAPRSLRRWQRAVEAQTRDLSLRLQRIPTDEELSDNLGVEISKMRLNRQILASTAREREVSLSGDSGHSQRPIETAAAMEWMPDAIQERKESLTLLMRSIEQLPPRSRRVVLLYYRQNLTMKQIGAILQVNESRVSQIHKNALETMNTVFQASCSRGETSLRRLRKKL